MISKSNNHKSTNVTYNKDEPITVILHNARNMNPKPKPRPTHLHGRAFGRELREAHDIREVNSDRLVGLGGHLPVLLQLLGHGGREHLVQEHVRALLLVGQLVGFVDQRV